MTQFAQRLRFDLPDTLTGNGERLSDFFERVLGAIFQSEAHLDDLLFARGQRAQDLCCLVLEVHVDYGFGRRDHRTVFDEIAQVRIFFFANRRFQRDRFLCDLQHLANLRDWNIHALGNLFAARLTPKLLHQLTRGADKLVDRFDHVHRNTHGAGLVGDRSRDRLSNPPRGVRRELVATTVFELVHGLHQADVAFLDEVEELQSAVGVLLCNRYDQAKVSFDQLFLRLLRIHVSLDNFALGPFQLGDTYAGLLLHALQV